MKIDVITAFPKILEAPLNESIIKQAQKRIDLKIEIWDLRKFAADKHRTLDDTPYGGGPGMVMKAEPIFRAFDLIMSRVKDVENIRVIFPTPQGEIFIQNFAEKLSESEHLIILCGHYKAVDQRVIDSWVTDEISVGDYVLSGGEIPSLLIIDALVRLIPGAIGDINSAKTDSFQEHLLDCPYYTRPEKVGDQRVPELLLTGNHKKIEEWRLRKKIEKTKIRRPDLYQKYLEFKKINNKT
jgi:tRNA (guanine37-N1)-methyltransferase